MEINSNRRNRGRQEVLDVLDEEKATQNSIEKWFAEHKTARLETMIPDVTKRDLNELLSCINTKGTGARKNANRLLVEAIADLFVKYQSGKGEFELTDKPHFRGEYK